MKTPIKPPILSLGRIAYSKSQFVMKINESIRGRELGVEKVHKRLKPEDTGARKRRECMPHQSCGN